MRISYLVVGSWVDKATNEVKVSLAQINGGTGKNGDYAFADTKSTKIEFMNARIGDVLTFDLAPVSVGG
jgi:hypothetical protein